MLKLATTCSCECITGVGGGGGECNLPIVGNKLLYLFIPETNADVTKHSTSYCMKFYIHHRPSDIINTFALAHRQQYLPTWEGHSDVFNCHTKRVGYTKTVGWICFSHLIIDYRVEKNLLVTCLPTCTHTHTCARTHAHTKLFSWHSTQVPCAPRNVANLSYLHCIVLHHKLLMVKLKNTQVWQEV